MDTSKPDESAQQSDLGLGIRGTVERRDYIPQTSFQEVVSVRKYNIEGFSFL